MPTSVLPKLAAPLLGAQAALGPDGMIYATGPGVVRINPSTGASTVLIPASIERGVGIAISVTPAGKIWLYGGLVIDINDDGISEWLTLGTARRYNADGTPNGTQSLPRQRSNMAAITIGTRNKKTLLIGGRDLTGRGTDEILVHSSLDDRDDIRSIDNALFRGPLGSLVFAGLGYARGTVFVFGDMRGHVYAIHNAGTVDLGPIAPVRGGVAVAAHPTDPNKLLVIGGFDGNSCSNTIATFNAQTMSFEPNVVGLDRSLAFADALTVPGVGTLVIGGYDTYSAPVGDNDGRSLSNTTL